jgi:hypothetical protein
MNIQTLRLQNTTAAFRSCLLVRIHPCEGQETCLAVLPSVSAPQQSRLCAYSTRLFTPARCQWVSWRGHDFESLWESRTRRHFFNLTSEHVIAKWAHNNGGGRSRPIVVIWNNSAAEAEGRSSYKNEHLFLICRCILIIVSTMFTCRQAISCHAGVYRKFTLIASSVRNTNFCNRSIQICPKMEQLHIQPNCDTKKPRILFLNPELTR